MESILGLTLLQFLCTHSVITPKIIVCFQIRLDRNIQHEMLQKITYKAIFGKNVDYCVLALYTAEMYSNSRVPYIDIP